MHVFLKDHGHRIGWCEWIEITDEELNEKYEPCPWNKDQYRIKGLPDKLPKKSK